MPSTTEPILTPRARGGWLAVSTPGAQLRLGVVGRDEQDARDVFAASVSRWAELCQAAKERDAEDT